MALTPINLPLGLINQVNPSQNNLSIQNGLTGDKQQVQSDFGKFLNDALDKLNNVQKDADKATFQLATGEAQDIHNVMIALEKANLSFSLAVEVRNKAINAYQEVMRMQI